MISKIRIGVSAAVIGLGALAGASSVSLAAPAGSVPFAAVPSQAERAAAATVEKVHFRPGLRRQCAARWGWQTRGYHRCLNRHGYRPVANYCRATRHSCADRWGWRTGRFHRCVRNHGC